MKLFLSSHNFGNFVDELKTLVGDNRKTLLVTNARDFLPTAERKTAVSEKLKLFKSHGFLAQELDLRPYFSKDPSQLTKFVNEYDPGLIFCIGGDVFMLATALAVSGLDDLIRERLAESSVVYAGCSAGACVTAHDIESYERDELRIEEIPDYYGIESVTSGLGLIPEHIIPHVDVPTFQERVDLYRTQLSKLGENIIELKDSDVYIINGAKKRILRGSEHLSRQSCKNKA